MFDALIDRAYDRLGRMRPLSRGDRGAWASAQTLADLGELTAQWLEGRIRQQPGYAGPVDVDEDDAPGLTAALIACNRAGFVTSGSQAAGYCGYDDDGTYWVQYAAVTGYADDPTLQWLTDCLAGPFEVCAWAAARRRPLFGWGRDEDCCHVTYRDGIPVTGFGRHTAGDVADIYADCGDGAVAAAVAAWQVTVYDPEPGRNDLWTALYEATSEIIT